ncbi:hypothetical protein FRD01_22575 [Microvenator marinus]|uniref:Restriction endonuclease n=1 Tax=Microvenator marinus TaxID=2600177 RepID=A0A5B8XYD0_9DELT|nr:hypothetical protein [Microvenator marinus]QED29968.1 hypothetical protein FRD01_22575 [Microvenator marinus]
MNRLTAVEYERVYLGDEDTITGERDSSGKTLIHPKHFRTLQEFDEGHAEESKQIFQWRSKYLQPKNWIGIVQVGSLIVEILPKIYRAPKAPGTEGQETEEVFQRKNLLYMLSLSGDLPLRDRDLASQSLHKAPISETLIRLFAEQLLEQLLLGVQHGYVHQEDNLRFLRGKLKFSQHIKHNFARADRFYTVYEEFLADTPLNRIFKATCVRLRDITRRPASQERLDSCLSILDEVSLKPLIAADFDNFTENRQNARFTSLINFCRLVWEGNIATGMRGKTATFALLFDMNAVFERFVAEFMRRHVIRDFPDAQLSPQSKGLREYLLWRLNDKDERKGVLELKPDILVMCGDSPRLIIDTKWKQLATEKGNRYGVTSGDLYQLYAYATRYDCSHNILLYPWVPDVKERDYELRDDARHRISTRFVDLSMDLTQREGREKLTDYLKIIVEGAIPQEEHHASAE